MKPSLVVLAAGLGSRYGGIKQLDGFGPNGERIIDYTIYDAIKVAQKSPSLCSIDESDKPSTFEDRSLGDINQNPL